MRDIIINNFNSHLVQPEVLEEAYRRLIGETTLFDLRHPERPLRENLDNKTFKLQDMSM
jgi:hypothetical protein